MTDAIHARTETKIAAAYLDRVAVRRKPQGRRNRAHLERRIETIQAQLAEGGLSGLERVELLQQRRDVERDLAALDEVKRDDLEEQFVEIVASWAERKGYSYATLREAGVPADVLRRAGIRQTRRR